MLILCAAVAAPLTLGTPVLGSISGEPLRYDVEVGKGDVFGGWVDQKSVDVVVRVLDPKGRVVAQIDGPARGRERFFQAVDRRGTWILEVEGFEGAAGDVEVALTVLEPLGATPAAQARQRLTPFGGDEPGGAVAVVVGGEVQFQAAFGVADLSHGIPFTPSTPTNIASMTKQLTAAVVLDLVGEGRLDLDVGIGTWLPDLQPPMRTITLRQLLWHRSGLRDENTLLALTGRSRVQPGSAPMLRMLAAQPSLQHEPGASFTYNNTGYELAALVAETASGESFEALMQKRVFDRYGMGAATVRTGPYVIVPGGARGYAAGDDGWIELPDDPGGRGAGGVYASIEDLARWAAALDAGLDGRLQAMATEPADGTYGMGLFVDRFEGLDRIHHGGDVGGFHSMLRYFPEHHVAVVTVVNSQQLDARVLADDLARIWLAPHLTPDPPAPPTAPGPPAEPWSPDVTALEAYRGRFVCDELGILFRVEVAAGHLVVRHPFSEDRVLEPVRPDVFGWGAMRYVFLREEGRVSGMEVDAIRSKGMRFERLP